MKIAGYALLLDAALQVAAVAAAGFPGGTLPLLIAAAIYVLLSAGLARGMMWVAWLAFIVVIVGSAATISGLFAPSPMPDWALWGGLAANVAALVLLFGAIWSGPKSGSVQ